MSSALCRPQNKSTRQPFRRCFSPIGSPSAFSFSTLQLGSGHVDKIVHPAYGPGSITDAASYEQFEAPLRPVLREKTEAVPEVTSGEDEYRRGMQKMRDMVNEFRAPILLQFFGEFCKFMDGHPGHPCDVFAAWMESRGTPMSPENEHRFNEAYNKE